MYEDLSRLEEHYLRCVRCGQCRSVCPVFSQIRNEAAAPRGKVFLAHLLSTGQVAAGTEVNHQLSQCLLCQACTRECPSAIPVHKIVAASRSLAARQASNPLKRLVYRQILASPALQSLSAGLLRGCQATGIMNLITNTSLPHWKLLNSCPMPRRTARALLSERIPATGKTKMRIGYFLGCATNYLFPDIARSTAAVLSRLGCEVVIPRELKCCGLPSLAGGEGDIALALTNSNLNVFRKLGVNTVVTDCASCFSALKDTRMDSKSSIDIMELSGFLADLATRTEAGLRKIYQTVTYHDPCHLSKAQGITRAPRELLRLVCDDFIEMPGADNCCGGGGSFAINHYKTSQAILNKKISSLLETGAKTVTTCCPSCLMQLRQGLTIHNHNAAIAHPVELLCLSLGLN